MKSINWPMILGFVGGLIFWIILVMVLSGCQQSKVSIVFDPNSGYFEYNRTGDIEIQEFEAVLVDGTKIKFGSSKSEDAAYLEGIRAAKEVVNNALDKIGGGR